MFVEIANGIVISMTIAFFTLISMSIVMRSVLIFIVIVLKNVTFFQ